MKRKFALLLSAALLLVCTPAAKRMCAFAAAEARGECVVEVSSKRFLHEKNADARLPMASTTKILTAILIIEDCELGESVTVPEIAEGTEGSSVYLKAGDTYTVRDLLYGLMLRSGNDCAVTLAVHHSGSVEAFAAEMTERANAMGAEHSNFANPHGLPDDSHYTTARDLALVSAYAMEDPVFAEIVSCKYYAPMGWYNKNKMLTRYEGACGVKTGFTTAAGRCLVTSAERAGMKLVSVVLNCPETYERTEELLDECFGQYRMIPIVDPSADFDGFALKRAFSYPLKKTELRALRFRTELFDPLPETVGDLAGTLEIYLENSLLFSENLYIMEK